MIKINIIFSFIFIIFYSNNVISANIVVIDIEELIDSNKYYNQILSKIKNSQKLNSSFLNKEEEELNLLIEEIDNSKLLLTETEINKLINNYNQKLNNYQIEVENFNTHYNQQIINIRKYVLQEIIVLTEKYAKNNDIDLVLDSASYLIASNELNITDFIKKELNNINLKLEFEDFEKN